MQITDSDVHHAIRYFVKELSASTHKVYCATAHEVLVGSDQGVTTYYVEKTGPPYSYIVLHIVARKPADAHFSVWCAIKILWHIRGLDPDTGLPLNPTAKKRD